MNADFIEISTDLLQAITSDQAWHYQIVPKEIGNSKLVFFTADSQDLEPLENELGILFGKDIELVTTDSQIIQKTLGKYYRRKKNANNRQSPKIEQADDFIESIINEANNIGSSDIHIETYEERCRVRMRIDGKLVERYVLKRDDYPAFINKIKIKANLDIAEKRLPQDGRILYHSGDEKFDIRVSILPTLYGEKIVMRLLSKDATEIDLNVLGMAPDNLKTYNEAIKKPHGIILISGPTGSGKTTTLYATLKVLNKEHSNIVTVEDPIEYTLEGINQVQLKESIGLTFARALRTFLRQDPDIIMLGEIRDPETAQMATRAALTGHLVLSTIHTNSAWGTISRLIDMGVPPFLVSGTLILSVAQRLVRLLCPECKEEIKFEKNLLPTNFNVPYKITKNYKAAGCENCYYTGYKGRTAIYEILPIDNELAEKIKHNELNSDFIKEKNIRLLPDQAYDLFAEGKTAIEEVYPILSNAT